MHPFPPVPDAARSRRDLRVSAPSRHWVRRVSLAAVCTLALVAVPLALSPTVVSPGIPDAFDLVAARDGDAASRSGGRAPASALTTTDPTTTDPATTDPATTDPATTDPATAPPPAPADVAAAPPVVPAPAPEPAPDPAPAEPTMVEQIVTRTNEERAAAGLPALTVSDCAAQQAVARTALLVAEGRFEHDPLEPILQACAARAVGENLALGYPTAVAVVAGWMGSEGHRANILSTRYTQIGVGCTKGARGILCAQVFVA